MQRLTEFTLDRRPAIALKKVAIVLLVCLVRIASAQTGEFISGTLVDKVSNEPVSFASIGISNSLLGTAADVQGAFTLRIEKSYLKEKLKISCIGYHSKHYSIDSLAASGTNNLVFRLDPDIALLDEVIVKSANINPAEVIQAAIQNVGKNYYQQPFNLELLSTIHANDSLTGNSFKAETVLFGYYEGYSSKGKKKFEILQKRTTGTDPLKTVNYGYWPSFEIISADLLTDPTKRGVLNPDLHKDFKFRYAGVSIYEQDTVYNIEYEAPRPTTKITGYGTVPKTYKGNIYITTSTNAVVRHEILTSSFTYHVIYKKVNGKYFPYYFSGDRSNEFKLPGGKRAFKTKNTVTVTRIILDHVKLIDPKANEYDINKAAYDETFWKAYYPNSENK